MFVDYLFSISTIFLSNSVVIIIPYFLYILCATLFPKPLFRASLPASINHIKNNWYKDLRNILYIELGFFLIVALSHALLYLKILEPGTDTYRPTIILLTVLYLTVKEFRRFFAWS
jgi:hypothetical protein